MRISKTNMLVFAAALCALALSGCNVYFECTGGPEPGAPYGPPDEVTRYRSGGHAEVTYVYHCINRRYVEVTYVRPEACSDYYEKHEYETRCGYATDGVEGPIEDESGGELEPDLPANLSQEDAQHPVGEDKE